MSPRISEEIVLAALRQITLPDAPTNIVEAGIVSSVVIDGENVGIIIHSGAGMTPGIEALRKKCETVVATIEGVERAYAVITSETQQPTAPKRPERKPPQAIPGVAHIIAVASGKGGVGKSTVSVHLATSLAELGYRVGLADADIHGPSVAHMMGIKEKPEVQNQKMIPIQQYGVKSMSMGAILDDEAPVIWRGPMVSKALHQLMLGADWGSLDYLIIDLPPGTGDIHLNITQQFALSGVVMVGTPQEVALLDVKKALTMFKKLSVPILGMVENMSYFRDPTSGEKTYLFGKGGMETLCEKEGITLLAELPLTPELATCCDQGTPLIITEPEHSLSQEYKRLAENVITHLAGSEEKKAL